MPFQPGQSGNPSGRPKDPGYLRQMARQHAEKAVGVLVAAMDDEDAKVRIKAAETLLDRGYGKPQQAVELTGAEGGPMETSLRVTFGNN